MPTVLVSASTPAADIAEPLRAAGFSVVEHVLGAVASVDFAGVAAAVIACDDRPDMASAQTRRWRAELGDDVVPISWVLPGASAALAARALDAGADAVLARPVEAPAIVSQVRSAARLRAAALRVAGRAAEARLLGEQLHRAHARLERELAAVQRARLALLPRELPGAGRARCAVCHRPRARSGGDFYDVRTAGTDRIAFFVGDVVGCSTAAGLLGVIAAQAAAARAGLPPGETLAAVNRDLLAIATDDRPLVALLAGTLDTRTGALVFARAGLPPPVFIPPDGEPEIWTAPGPFLGSADTTYPVRAGSLGPSGKFVIGSDGLRADGGPGLGNDRLLEVAAHHRALSGQAFVDAIARDILTGVQHEDDFTVMVVEM